MNSLRETIKESEIFMQKGIQSDTNWAIQRDAFKRLIRAEKWGEWTISLPLISDYLSPTEIKNLMFFAKNLNEK